MKHTNSLESVLHAAGLLRSGTGRDIEILGLNNDSRTVSPGDLFICKGYGFKPEYLLKAREAGAVCYMAEEQQADCPLPSLIVSDVRKAQSLAAQWFYDRPSDAFTLVGITGTKGKTTTTYMTHAVMDAVAGTKTGLLSGMEHDMGGQVTYTHLTTPESLEMQQLFAEARKHMLPVVTAEISSQAYQVHRTYGQHFRYGIFLNIGPDHISPHEHPTMEDYLRCKEALLENSDVAIIVRSTDYFDHVLAAAKKANRTIVVGMAEDGECDYAASNIQKLPRGYAFTVTEKATGRHDIYKIAMDGLFNIENALAAIGVGRLLGAGHEQMAAALDALEVPGRMNRYEGGGVHVLVDCMHNRASSQALLTDLKRDYPGAPITVVTGIAGGRSPQRIQGMGEMCGKYADRIFFTTDNPDFDDPADIAGRLAHAAAQGGDARVTIQLDRTRAVEQAILEAPEGAVIVLAGKGNDAIQRVRGGYVHYDSDPVVARRALALREKQRT